MTGRARKETQSMKQVSGDATPRVVSNDPTQPEAGSLNRKMCGNESPREVNDLLVTADTDDRPHEVLPPYESAGQSSERVAALAPRLRRQVDNVDHRNARSHEPTIPVMQLDRVGILPTR